MTLADVRSRFAQTSVVVPDVVTVHVPEPASKNTLSDDVGTAAPPAPPEVVAHFVPAVPSQVAVPPHLLLPYGGRTSSDSSHWLHNVIPSVQTVASLSGFLTQSFTLLSLAPCFPLPEVQVNQRKFILSRC